MGKLKSFLFTIFLLIYYHDSFALITFEDCPNPKALLMTTQLIQKLSESGFFSHLASYGPIIEGYPTYRDIRAMRFYADWKSIYSPVAIDTQSPKGEWSYMQILEMADDRTVFKADPNFLPNPEHLLLLPNEYEAVKQQLLNFRFALVHADDSENIKFIILQSCDGRNTWIMVSDQKTNRIEVSNERLKTALTNALSRTSSCNEEFEEKKVVKLEYQYGQSLNSEEFEDKKIVKTEQ